MIINQIYQHSKILKLNNNKEKFTSSDKLTRSQKRQVRDFISKTYQADIESIRNLSTVATKLQKGGLTVAGNLKITGKFNYLPRGVIMAYNSPTAPPGWAICDGKNGTPDLRGRFIRMHTNELKFGGDGNSYISANLKGSYASAYGGLRRGDPKVWRLRQNFGSYGGSDITKQDVSQMANHNHRTSSGGNHTHAYQDVYFQWPDGNIKTPIPYQSKNLRGSGRGHTMGHRTDGGTAHGHNITSSGSSYPMNNQPSYYVLTWIMKL